MPPTQKPKKLPPLPPKEPAARPWRWWHDKPAGMWYLVNGPEGKQCSVIPALQGFDDFDQRPEAKLILKAVNQYDIVRELVTALHRYVSVVETEYQTLTDGQFGRFNSKPVAKDLAVILAKLLDVHEK